MPPHLVRQGGLPHISVPLILVPPPTVTALQPLALPPPGVHISTLQPDAAKPASRAVHGTSQESGGRLRTIANHLIIPKLADMSLPENGSHGLLRFPITYFWKGLRHAKLTMILVLSLTWNILKLFQVLEMGISVLSNGGLSLKTAVLIREALSYAVLTSRDYLSGDDGSGYFVMGIIRVVRNFDNSSHPSCEYAGSRQLEAQDRYKSTTL
ncbi:hypothetical protein B0T17DRAFT_519822, partial [Bombardia bombarda]